ncbi:MAG: hypothetical protein RQ826_12760, partial [Xanthomonadales bacterium]|nr:hypothetical protein [Xanthomonadales bacterium]
VLVGANLILRVEGRLAEIALGVLTISLGVYSVLKPRLGLHLEARHRDLRNLRRGRLFDAAAALVLGRHVASFEGQGPMELEQIAADGCVPIALPLAKDESGIWRSDWGPMLETLRDSGIPVSERAGIFHETMAQALLDQARAIRAEVPFDAVGLSGGVFQNRRLTERVVERLAEHAIEVRLHRGVPANDGGLCFGQVIEVLARQLIP